MAFLSYSDKLKSIRNYTSLGIKSKKNFSRRDKWLITRYYNEIKFSGYFEYDKDDKEFIPKIKFVRTKNKKNKLKGAPRIKGYFVQGANPGDKVRNGKIIKGNFEKIFIPLDFSNAVENAAEDPESDYDYYDDIYDELDAVLSPYYDELTFGTYFTIVLINGWELGQNKKSKTPKNKRKDGQAFSEDLEGENKIADIAKEVTEQFQLGQSKYKIEIIKGIYLWKFINQREPTAKEKRAMKGKKKWKQK